MPHGLEQGASHATGCYTMTPVLRMARRAGLCVCVLGALLPTLGWADRPEAPRVVVTPEAGKPPDMFAAEQDFCRSEAEAGIESNGGSGSVLRSAVVGTVLGAAAGAVFSGHRHDNTGAGALAGLLIGAANGASRQSADDEYAQRRYDAAYAQCMLAKGNGTPSVVYRQAVPRYVPPPRTLPPRAPAPHGVPPSAVPPDYVDPNDADPDAPPPDWLESLPPPPPSHR